MIVSSQDAWSAISDQMTGVTRLLCKHGVTDFRFTILPEIRRGQPRLEMIWDRGARASGPELEQVLRAPAGQPPVRIRAIGPRRGSFDMRPAREAGTLRDELESGMINLGDFARASQPGNQLGKVEILGSPTGGVFPVVMLGAGPRARHWPLPERIL